MSQDSIIREVGEQSKGPRLQKLRAIKYLLDEMENGNISVYVTIEYQDDVYKKSVNNNESEEFVESDKNYDSTNSFTFMSDEIRNSLVSFIDCFIINKMSESLYFNFYTNVNYGKEYQTKNVKQLGVILPEEPILEYLVKNEVLEEELINTIKVILLDEYKRQYEKIKKAGHFDTIKDFSNDIWRDFFKHIYWKFGQEDDKQLEKTLLDKIRISRIYDGLNICGKERYILGALESLLEKKQQEKDYLAKLISNSDVKIIYLEIANGVNKTLDPIYELWEQMEKPTDKRNIREKILDVCANYDQRKLSIIARKIASVKIELHNIDIKEKGSFQYRIFEACYESLYSLLTAHEDDVKPEIIEQWLDGLYNVAQRHLVDKSKDYSYPIKSQDTIKNTILELFDSCYLSFNIEG